MRNERDDNLLRNGVYSILAGAGDAVGGGVVTVYEGGIKFSQRTWDYWTTPAPSTTQRPAVEAAREQRLKTTIFLDAQKAVESEPEKKRLLELALLIKSERTNIEDQIKIEQNKNFLTRNTKMIDALETDKTLLTKLSLCRTLAALRLRAKEFKLEEHPKFKTLNEKIVESVEEQITLTDKISRGFNAYFKR